MIKINLLKSIPLGDEGDGNAGAGFDSGKLRSLAIRNIILIVCGPVALIFFEDQNLTTLRAELAAKSKILSEVQEKNSRAKSAVEESKRYRENLEKMDGQIKIVDVIKKGKNRNFVLLDQIRKAVPEKVWLEHMEVIEDRIQLRGYAVADSDLTTFMDGLSRSSILKEVNLLRSQDQTTTEFGNIKRFELACVMEYKE